MLDFTLPYQSNINKKIFDYFLNYCKQTNNVNYALTKNDSAMKKENKIFLLFDKGKAYLHSRLSKYDNEADLFYPLMDAWSEIYDVVFNDSFNDTENTQVYCFDIKRFYNLLSFSSDYKNRGNINLCISDDYKKIKYRVSDTVFVDIAEYVNNTIKYKILESYNAFIKAKQESDTILSVTNVDKNSFLLPYFNYKDCLNSVIASTNSMCEIHKTSDENYIKIYSNNITKDKNYPQNRASALLRKDKFNLKTTEEDVLVSSALWQLLVMLQNNKTWKTLDVYDLTDIGNVAKLVYYDFSADKEYNIYNICYINPCNIKLKENTYNKELYFVGKLYSDEIFMLDKLFQDKDSYFDFSLQCFMGNGYVFDDNNSSTKEKQMIPFRHAINSNKMPLRVTFAEIRHYVGSDLSQKNFVLYFYTDGISVLLNKYNNKETIVESSVNYKQNEK